MIEEVIFAPEAEVEVVEGYFWYESRAPGLGEAFLRCIEARLQTIQRQPLLYPVAIDQIRRALIRRFPYEIFYEPFEQRLFVYSVFPCSSDPEKWRRRFARE